MKKFQPSPQQKLTRKLSARSKATLRAKQARRDLNHARATYARYTSAQAPQTR